MRNLIETGLKRVERVFRAKAKREIEDLYIYSYDASRKSELPWIVVFPEEEEEIIELVNIAREFKLPIIPRGAGSGLVGGTVPVEGGVILSMESMTRIRDIDEKNLVAVVEPGLITSKLHDEVEKCNLFYPPDPASAEFSTIGGNVATNAGGLRAVKYGVTEDYVLSLRVVLSDGFAIKTRKAVLKDVSGYNLTSLFIGSEGTLGIISEVTLRLIPEPETRGTLLAFFDSPWKAIEAGISLFTKGVLPCTMEFMDRSAVDVVKEYTGVEMEDRVKAVLLIEDDGFEESVIRSMNLVEDTMKEFGAISIQWRVGEKGDQSMWSVRRAISPSLTKIAPFRINQDVVVLRTRIRELLEGAERIGQKVNLPIVNFGHLGDGNVHVNILFGRGKEEEEKAKEGVKELLALVNSLDGSITGEHGIGMVKLVYLKKYIDPNLYGLMKKIKELFDPHNILNPGKLVP